VDRVGRADGARSLNATVPIVVPNDGKDDTEVLKRTVDLVSQADVADRRAEFHELLASLDAEGLQDGTIIGLKSRTR
jgi:hypothetical protein